MTNDGRWLTAMALLGVAGVGALRGSSRGSKIRRRGPPVESPYERGLTLMRLEVALRRAFDFDRTEVKTIKGPRRFVSLDAVVLDELEGMDSFPGLELEDFSITILYTSSGGRSPYTFLLRQSDGGLMASFDRESVTDFLRFLERSAELILDARGVSPYVFERGDRVFVSKATDSPYKGRYGTVKARSVREGMGVPVGFTVEGEDSYLVETRVGGGMLWFRSTDLRKTKR